SAILPSRVLAETNRGLHPAVGEDSPEAILDAGHGFGQLGEDDALVVLVHRPRANQLLDRVQARHAAGCGLGPELGRRDRGAADGGNYPLGLGAARARGLAPRGTGTARRTRAAE